MKADETKTEISIEVDGEGIHTSNVNSVSAYELAACYFRLLCNIGAMEEKEFQLCGVDTRNKCVALVAATKRSLANTARISAIKANRYVQGRETPSRGLGVDVKRLQKALRQFPAGNSIKTVIGKWSEVLTTEQKTDNFYFSESISLRVYLYRAGGLSPATATFRSYSENKSFAISLDTGILRDIRHYLSDELEITATVTRNSDGDIDGGTLDSFRPVQDVDSKSAWRNWYTQSGSQWDDIDDIEKELDRDDD